jgi:hypothetical protein
VSPCEYGNEPSCSMTFYVILQQLNDWRLLEEDSDPSSYGRVELRSHSPHAPELRHCVFLAPEVKEAVSWSYLAHCTWSSCVGSGAPEDRRGPARPGPARPGPARPGDASSSERFDPDRNSATSAHRVNEPWSAGRRSAESTGREGARSHCGRQRADTD